MSSTKTSLSIFVEQHYWPNLPEAMLLQTYALKYAANNAMWQKGHCVLFIKMRSFEYNLHLLTIYPRSAIKKFAINSAQSGSS